MTDEVLAARLSLKRPASARFWRLKAIEILNADQEKDNTELNVPVQNVWATAGTLANESVAANG